MEGLAERAIDWGAGGGAGFLKPTEPNQKGYRLNRKRAATSDRAQCLTTAAAWPLR